MSLKSYFEKKIKKFTFWDFALTKIVLIVLGIIVGAYISIFVKEYIWWFVAVFVIGYVIILFRTFRK